MEDPSSQPGLHPLSWGLVALLAGLCLAAHMAASGAYGYFRDELYFLDCGRHLAWGYVDDAPMIALFARIGLLLGGSLPAIRLLPALAGAGTVALAMVLARELGGGRFAQALAGLCTLAAPVFLALQGMLYSSGFEPLFWMGCVVVLLRLLRGGDARLWLAFGAVAGLGIEARYSTLLFLAVLLGAILASPLRREARKRWFWAGAALALAIALPTLLWQVRHQFPLLQSQEHIHQVGKNIVLGPAAFLLQQVLLLNPPLLPFWLGGLGWLLFGGKGRFRILGWTGLVLFLAMFLLKAKNYYLAPICPLLFAAGAAAAEAGLQRWRRTRDRAWPKAVAAAWAALAFLLVAPAMLPLLPPARLLAYQAALRINPPRTEAAHRGPLEQRLGDRFGWPELVAETAAIHAALPPGERSRTAIFAGNYGEAGAVDQFGPALGLPAAVCAHQACFFWGPPAAEPATVICLGCDRAFLERYFTSVEQAGVHFHPWGMAAENRPIFLARGLRRPLRELWPELKRWD
jgi:hypothetical protein